MVKLRGGALEYLERDGWCSLGAVDVVLPEHVVEFLEKRVEFMQDKLASLKCWVKRVDAPAPGSSRSRDLWTSFWGPDALADGNLGLEHKFVFGRRGFGAAAEKHQKEARQRFRNLRGVSGQLLWLAQVSDSATLSVLQDKLYILLDAAGHWKELRLQVPRSKPLRFDGVWGACEQDGKRENKRTRVVRVAEFLQNAGVPSRKPLQRISGWTSGSMKLGLKKGVHFWTQQWAQGRGQHPWVASKATLRKVWPHLRE